MLLQKCHVALKLRAVMRKLLQKIPHQLPAQQVMTVIQIHVTAIAVAVAEDEVALAHIDSLWIGPGFIGTVSSQRILRVRAEAPGTLVTVPVSVGQEVAAGALMALFDDRSARERIQVVQAAEAQAKRRIGLGITGLADALIFCNAPKSWPNWG